MATAALIGVAMVSSFQTADASEYCSNFVGPTNDGLLTGDVTLDGVSATDCFGVIEVTGDPSVSQVNSAFGSRYDGGNFTQLFKVEGGGTETGSSLDGYTFSIENIGFSESGEFDLEVTGGDLPAFFDLVFGLKASPGAALYIFDDFEIADSTTDGTYRISFDNPGGQTPDLSNMTLFGRSGEGDDDDNGNGGGIPGVPEPATLALIGAGLAGLGLASRRRRRQS